MAIGRQKPQEELRLNLSPMIDVVFLILIYFIVSMQLEPSLDNIIKLPPVLRASKQEDALLQIYILPAKVKQDGSIVPDSTGLIAFSDKAKTPDSCRFGHPIIDPRTKNYLPGSMVDAEGRPISDLQKAKADAFRENAPPPVFFCSRYKEHPDYAQAVAHDYVFPPSAEIGPYVKLEEIPLFLREKKKEVFAVMLANRNSRRARDGKDPLSAAEEKELEESIPLMIKADDKTFYGRILQVVNMAKDTTAGIKNFAFVTLPDASAEVQQKLLERMESN